MFLKVGNILGMDQVLLGDIVARVVLFEMVNLVLILVVAVVSGAGAEIGQRETACTANGEFGKGDCAAEILVVDVEDLLRNVVFLLRGDMVGGFVQQAVGFLDVVDSPLATAVVIVQVEEGARVERVDVVFLYAAATASARVFLFFVFFFQTAE